MKYIFFGTPDFAAHCLERLLEHGFVPSAVVCNPDRPTGRKKIITPPPVKTAAIDWSTNHGTDITILQPEKLDENFQKILRALDPDLFLVYAYNKIFKKELLAIPRSGAIGIHPSLLPEYRGPSPFQTAILDGKTETGVTLYRLDEGIDSGPVFAKSGPVAITDEDTFPSLAAKLADAAADLAIKKLPDIAAGKMESIPQDESRATYTKKFTAQDGYVAPDELAAAENGANSIEKTRAILRRINAFNPEPGAWTIQNGKRLKLLEAKIENNKLLLTLTQEEGAKPKKPF
jgi:methionyl-tRNA formyltransferase